RTTSVCSFFDGLRTSGVNDGYGASIMMQRNLISMGAVSVLLLSALLRAAAPSSVVEAAMQGNKDAVRTLLKQGADVNTAQGDGMTALHWAAQKGDLELAQTLLYAGANIPPTTGPAALVDALLAGGADPNLATSNGATPLMMAAQGGNADVVKALIARGADVNPKEKVKNETALMIAASYGRADVIRALTAHGADLAATTKVLDMAVFNKEEGKRLAQFQA